MYTKAHVNVLPKFVDLAYISFLLNALPIFISFRPALMHILHMFTHAAESTPVIIFNLISQSVFGGHIEL
jgi:hypothetical protein